MNPNRSIRSIRSRMTVTAAAAIATLALAPAVCAAGSGTGQPGPITTVPSTPVQVIPGHHPVTMTTTEVHFGRGCFGAAPSTRKVSVNVWWNGIPQMYVEVNAATPTATVAVPDVAKPTMDESTYHSDGKVILAVAGYQSASFTFRVDQVASVFAFTPVSLPSLQIGGRPCSASVGFGYVVGPTIYP